MWKSFFKRHKISISLLVIMLTGYYFCLPRQLFKDPTATVIESTEGVLLGAKIAEDGQWRFPVSDTIPDKFKRCIINFEDAYFYKHPGFNPLSILKALSENIKAGKIVRGGSTLTQQVIRLSRKGKSRSYFEKGIELILATRLELRTSKDNILKLYAGNAPFGGNVVGLEMASWRYFGVAPNRLSWAESATLAVLPNAPSLIFPGKNQLSLLKKRNRLLKKLYDKEEIDSITYILALEEDLPQKPFSLPQTATHLVENIARSHKGDHVKTTISFPLQESVNQIVKSHYNVLSQNHIFNISVLVMDVKTRRVKAYVGNAPTDRFHEKDVDMITANRSTGSLLKPILYAAMLDNGELLPEALVADIPTEIAGYTPENFHESYDGAVIAKRALSRSLNIPAVRLLQSYGLEKFRAQLDFFELDGIDRPADHYGLTLILGGAETNLWDLCKMYANLASTVNNYTQTSSEYFTEEFTNPVLIDGQQIDLGQKTTQKNIFDAGSIYLTFEAMQQANRPTIDEAWEFYDSSQKIAWKTGTSFGNKDAWAIGVTRDYVVGVWAGNADGEGRPDNTGINSAAPILFDVFNVLPYSQWFHQPFDALRTIEVCAVSGCLPNSHCPKKEQWVPENGIRFKTCPFHKLVHLDSKEEFRVNTSCEPAADIVSSSWFVLPPLMEFYYKKKNPLYKSLPPFRSDCDLEAHSGMQFIYPKPNAIISLARDFDSNLQELVLKLAHSRPESKVFWYLDETYLGTTQDFHEIAILPEKGEHFVTVFDEFGNEAKAKLIIN